MKEKTTFENQLLELICPKKVIGKNLEIMNIKIKLGILQYAPVLNIIEFGSMAGFR